MIKERVVSNSETTLNLPVLTREDIEARARSVREKFGLKSIPINPLTIAERVDIAVNNAKFFRESVAGAIARSGNKVVLLVNQSDAPYRKRFTIAHELGHYFLHLHGDGEFIDKEVNLFRQPKGDPNGWTPVQRAEYQANMFAAALLMPEDAVQKAWDETASLERLAREFNVSEQAMGIRLDQMGLLDEEKGREGKVAISFHKSVTAGWA